MSHDDATGGRGERAGARPSERLRPAEPLHGNRFGNGARGQSGRMVIGPGVQISGEVEGCELLLVQGHMRGHLSDVKRLEIAASGRLAGRVETESCRIEGGFEGELAVDGLLSLESRGRVKGTVRYREVEVARGAVISGTVDVAVATPFEPPARSLFDGAQADPTVPTLRRRSKPLLFARPRERKPD